MTCNPRSACAEDVPLRTRDLGRVAVAGALVLYGASILIATYPAVRTAGSRLAVADLNDPVQHLWTLRWYRTCLLQG